MVSENNTPIKGAAPVVFTSEFLATVMGVGERRLSTLVRDGVLPKTIGRGKYDAASVIQSMWARIQQQAKGGTDEVRRLRAAKAGIAELDLDERKGELISADDAERCQRRLVTEARQLLLALPPSLARQVPKEYSGHIEEQAQIQMRAALRTLAEGLPEGANGLSDAT